MEVLNDLPLQVESSKLIDYKLHETPLQQFATSEKV
jgi:hypothetical protein